MKTETHTPKVSVVIPLYNKGPYIARAIDSVLAQSEQEFEIVIVDDASTDGGAETVKTYSDHRIRLIHRDAPGAGGHAARNAGIKNAAAPLIAFLDADDRFNPEHLAVILGLAAKYEAAGAYATCIETVWENGQRTVWKVSPLRSAGAEDVLIADFCRHAQLGPVISTSATAIPKKTFDEVGLFPEGVPLGGDLDMWMRVGVKYPVAVSAYVGCVSHRDAGNRIDTGRIKGMEYELVRTGLRLLSSAHLHKEQRRHLREYISMYQLITAKQLVLLGERDRARRMLLQCRTIKYIFRKAWWLFWTLIPTPLTLEAQRIKKRMNRGGAGLREAAPNSSAEAL